MTSLVTGPLGEGPQCIWRTAALLSLAAEL